MFQQTQNLFTKIHIQTKKLIDINTPIFPVPKFLQHHWFIGGGGDVLFEFFVKKIAKLLAT